MTNNKGYIFFFRSGVLEYITSNGAIDYTEKGEFCAKKRELISKQLSFFHFFFKHRLVY